MKLYLKQQPHLFGDRFFIHNESNREFLAVEEELFSDGKKIHIFNMKNKELACISLQASSQRPRYHIEMNGRDLGFVIQRFALVGKSFDLDRIGWSAEGSFGAHEFSVFNNERLIMTVKKTLFAGLESTEMAIASDPEALAAVCMLLAIDLAVTEELDHE